MTRDQIVQRVREAHPEMTEEQIDASLAKLTGLGLIEQRRQIPRNLPLTAEAEAVLVEELSLKHPEALVQGMVDRMVEAGILVRKP